MNNPEYILVDEIETVVSAVKTALSLPVLNYQYGYITELNETLNEYSKTAEYKALKFPLVWLSQPFTIRRDSFGYYGKVKIDLFIFNKTDVNLKAEDRMTNNFKPTINPIARELIIQISKSRAFNENAPGKIVHEETDRYYWDGINPTITDIVDWKILKGVELTIKNNCP